MHSNENSGAWGDWPWNASTERIGIYPASSNGNGPQEPQESWPEPLPPAHASADVFLRRMIMWTVLVGLWAVLIFGAVFALRALNAGPSDVYPANAPSLLACSPGEKDC